MHPDLFIRKICHDLRAPVRALTELPQWLTEDLEDQVADWPEAARETLDMMQTQAGRLDALIDGLSGLVKLTRLENSPKSDVRAVLEGMDVPDMTSLNLAIDTVPMEEGHLILVLSHLIGNVMKHGLGHEQPFLLETLQSKALWAIRISDNGPGIDEKYREKVFEPLSTLKPRDDCEGSGLGLSVVARIAELYGGGCKIDAKPGFSGAVVTFFAPHNVPPAERHAS